MGKGIRIGDLNVFDSMLIYGIFGIAIIEASEYADYKINGANVANFTPENTIEVQERIERRESSEFSRFFDSILGGAGTLHIEHDNPAQEDGLLGRIGSWIVPYLQEREQYFILPNKDVAILRDGLTIEGVYEQNGLREGDVVKYHDFNPQTGEYQVNAPIPEGIERVISDENLNEYFDAIRQARGDTPPNQFETRMQELGEKYSSP